jgi:hypothetical protein
MEIVLVGARRFPESRRRRVVLPAPLAPMRRVRLDGGRLKETLRRPREWSGKVNVRFVTVMEGAISVEVVGMGRAIFVVVWEGEWRGEERRGEERGWEEERDDVFLGRGPRDLLSIV